jgi:hypothetical protein
VSCAWSLSGASTRVATRPASTCHSMWQWNKLMRAEDVSLRRVVLREDLTYQDY